MLDKTYLLEALNYYKDETTLLGNVYYAGMQPKPPELAYQVHFPRIEMVLVGEIEMELGSYTGAEQRRVFKQGDIIYLPAESWNQPTWEKPVVTMTVMQVNRALV